ncbi:protein-methionine-sulfoxide reductase heme-binding subunit MsrQ [Shewanella youngdeokensis]|uniref:Protein-methionine-sulfoxide reductase heme-binding subunit MsrQ n=1 Tax=Shewanella youngdeokensis TaxID=2999068 RepID=A0ABZ0JV52_9GAMM|nr:protein-methionine-sulfoxide reductase heme-binding subunit MsrQ [Shewanella sp. DAU334]
MPLKLTSRSLFWLKVWMHGIGLTPIIYLFLTVFNGNAGGDPVQYIIHYTGIGALNALVLTLLISPVARKLKLGALLQTRRLVGLYVFAYASLHIMAFFSLDLLFAWRMFFDEVTKRPYILVGAIAYLLLLALAVTSFKSVMRKMGRRWQRLHNGIYLIALLVPIHFYWSVKSEIIEPILYFFIIGWLLAVRVYQSKLLKHMLDK